MRTMRSAMPPSGMMPDVEPALRLERVTKSFGGEAVVRDVSLDVAPGEVVSIIGPSGAGKSTLLRCINFLAPPDGGRVLVAGRPAGDDLAALRRKVGMVFQSFNLFPHLTALRNVSLPQQRVLRRGREEADARSRELLARVGLSDRADAHPGRCSGGEQQRIAIARALALEPEIMLFDEPTSAIDPELGIEVLAVMRQLAGDGMTMLVVTHELRFAERVSDRVVMMADGAVVESGPPEAVLMRPHQERTRRFLRAVLER
jgi:polar amino acid transport system ATP-binding protein